MLYRYTLFVAFSTFCLLIAGGLVTSTGSGLSVPDWPLSYGTLAPPMVGNIRFEHSHRLIAGAIGILTLVLSGWIWAADSRRWMRWLGAGASVMVLLQAVLGGLTVIHLLPTWISAFHASLGQTFFVLVAALAYFQSSEWRSAERRRAYETRKLKSLLIATTAFIYIQLILGSVIRHGAPGYANLHIALGLLIGLHIIFIFSHTLKDPVIGGALGGHAQLLAGLVFAQILLGGGAYVVAILTPRKDIAAWSEVWIRTAHQSNGALVLVACVLLLLRIYRRYERVR